MDASPAPRQTLSLLVEIDRAPKGRPEGRIRATVDDAWTPFSGVLELLKVLQEVVETESLGPSAADESFSPEKGRP
jgi:hypothetical protein